MSTSVYDPLAAESDSENQPLVPASTDGILHKRLVGWLKSVGKWSRENLLLLLTILSVVVGIIIGVSVHPAHPDRVAIELIAFPGELFLRMLKMLILPLLIFSLMAGLGSLDTKVAGALGWRTVVYYFCTTVLAVILGLILVLSIRPGARGSVEKPCDNSSLSVQRHQLETIDAVLDLLR